MSNTIKLTEKEQWQITLALELEDAGFIAAAQYLRDKVAVSKDIKWNDDPKKHTAWENILRVHHGSNPQL